MAYDELVQKDTTLWAWGKCFWRDWSYPNAMDFEKVRLPGPPNKE